MIVSADHTAITWDMSIDGPGNSVYEVDSIPEPDPELNPHHNAWITRDTLVASESEAGSLRIRPGAPLLLVERTAFGWDGTPFEYARDLFRGDRTRVVVESRLPER